MSLEIEVAELRGQVAVLERLIMESVTKQIIDVRVLALNAEAVANRSFENVQAFVAQLQAEGGSSDEYGEGVIDTRSGGVSRQPNKKKEVDESS